MLKLIHHVPIKFLNSTSINQHTTTYTCPLESKPYLHRWFIYQTEIHQQISEPQYHPAGTTGEPPKVKSH